MQPLPMPYLWVCGQEGLAQGHLMLAGAQKLCAEVSQPLLGLHLLALPLVCRCVELFPPQLQSQPDQVVCTSVAPIGGDILERTKILSQLHLYLWG